MGSKRSMLGNGLGKLLEVEVPSAKRFVDLFTGSGAVAVHVACRFDLPVIAFDLQSYSSVLAGAVIKRKEILPVGTLFNKWHMRAKDFVNNYRVPLVSHISKKFVTESRKWCADQEALPITAAYGGHYFSPEQAVWIDAFRASLPKSDPIRTVALAALIQASSHCAAAPGHTAQPFQPTSTAIDFLFNAWNRNLIAKIYSAFKYLATLKANRIGYAKVSDAIKAARLLKNGDLAFIDPPYSGVHYSRFYHVLETISIGSCGEVTGIGRYPDKKLRPKSNFSLTSKSEEALDTLLKTISSRGAKAILTFPDHRCSNGLSGDSVRNISSKYFLLQENLVDSKFSTLGGTSDKQRKQEARRPAHIYTRELMLVMNPK